MSSELLPHAKTHPVIRATTRDLRFYERRSQALLPGSPRWYPDRMSRITARRQVTRITLGEAVRRRRATGGPAEHTFHHLVGLELRPRRLRDAANLFAALENAGGADARDAAWDHPDIAPGDADLDDPLGYVERIMRGRRTELGGPAQTGPSPESHGLEAAPRPLGPRGDAQAGTGPGRPAEHADTTGMDDMDAALARLLDEESGKG